MKEEIGFWFSGVERLGEIALGGVLLFIFLIVLVRLLGKRATAQMNNFDWVIAVATGSLLASGILLRNISYTDAALAMVVIGACQYAVTKLFAYFPDLAEKAKAQPRLLLHKGHYLEDAMKDERITRAEVNARLRQAGLTNPAGANWVILEADGQLSVIPRDDSPLDEADCLIDVVFDGDALGALDPKPWPEKAAASAS